MNDPRQWHIGLVGYGEVGRILAEDLRAQGIAVSACDVKLGTPAGAALEVHAAKYGVGLVARASQKQVVNVAQKGGMCAVLMGRVR